MLKVGDRVKFIEMSIFQYKFCYLSYKDFVGKIGRVIYIPNNEKYREHPNHYVIKLDGIETIGVDGYLWINKSEIEKCIELIKPMTKVRKIGRQHV